MLPEAATPGSSHKAANNPSALAHFHRLRDALRADLAAPLPGREAQYRMMPKPREGITFRGEAGPDARQGGVLALIYLYEERAHVALILRPTYAGVHSGQVAFPGGGKEPGDADLTATALREAYEETGIVPENVEILGTLSPLFVVASNYLVVPTVGWSDTRPDFRPDPYEVAQIVEAPLADLLNTAHLRREEWTLRGYQVDVPFFAVAGQRIWGATAMMLSELLALPAVQDLGSI
jgi:8-oxo-dGTP pyrophosphatase MutT (NUDIX family)